MVALAYTASGNIDKAKKIIDLYMSKENVWRLGGLIGGVFAYEPNAGVSWLVWSGENLWMGIASFHLYKATGEKKYLSFAIKLADFNLSLQNKDKTDINYGGIPLGPKGDPIYPKDQAIVTSDIFEKMPDYSFTEIFATEHNIDAYALFNLLYQETKNEKYNSANKNILIWIKKAGFNKTQQRFNRGCRKEPDENVATDVQTWGISALGVEVLDTIEAGLAINIIEFVENNCVSIVSFIKPDGKEVFVKGADFIDKKTAKKLNREVLVSPEWTFQLINAYQRLSSDFERLGKNERSNRYSKKRLELLKSMMELAIDDNGTFCYPYATLPDVPKGHGFNTPKKGNLSVIGAAQAILSILNYDPLVYGF